MNVNFNKEHNITFKSRLKSLNALNPISYYSNRYLKRSAKLSQKNTEPICPELFDSWSLYWTKSGKERITIYDFSSKTHKPDKYVMFLHGMAQDATNYQSLYKNIIDKNIGVWAIEYRGYGINNSCSLSENKIRTDIENAYQYLLKRKGIKPQDIIVIGHSMGGSLAADFATKHHDIKSLILLSPLYNAANLGEKFMEHKKLGEGIPKALRVITDKIKPLKWLYSLRFNTINKLKNIKTPTYIIQSLNDSVTPISPAKHLAKTAKEQGILEQFITLPGGGHKVDNDKINIVSNILDSFVK